MRRALIGLMSFGLIATAVVGGRGVAAQDATPSACVTTTEEENIALATAYIEAVEAMDLAAIDDLLADDFVHNQDRYGQPDDPMSNADEHNLAVMFEMIYPGSVTTLDHVIADGETIVVASTLTITQTHLDPSAEPVTLAEPLEVKSIGIFVIECGEIVEAEVVTDELGLLTGIGAIPAMNFGAEATPTS